MSFFCFLSGFHQGYSEICPPSGLRPSPTQSALANCHHLAPILYNLIDAFWESRELGVQASEARYLGDRWGAGGSSGQLAAGPAAPNRVRLSFLRRVTRTLWRKAG